MQQQATNRMKQASKDIKVFTVHLFPRSVKAALLAKAIDTSVERAQTISYTDLPQ